jgi:hypothetical protein
MRVKVGFVAVAVVLALLGFAVAGAVAHGASSHQSGCHTQHSCPSDHHTYVWTDTSTGLLWDCAEPGAAEYDPEGCQNSVSTFERGFGSGSGFLPSRWVRGGVALLQCSVGGLRLGFI